MGSRCMAPPAGRRGPSILGARVIVGSRIAPYREEFANESWRAVTSSESNPKNRRCVLKNLGQSSALTVSATPYLGDGGPGRDDAYGLTPRRFRFVMHLVVYEHATRAYLASGWRTRNSKVARAAAGQLLASPAVRRAVALERHHHQQASLLSVPDIQAHLAATATFDVADLLDADGDLRPLHKIPARVRRLVQSVEHKDAYGKHGELLSVTKKIRTPDRTQALNVLMKHLGLFEADNAQQQQAAGWAALFGAGAAESIPAEYALMPEETADQSEAPAAAALDDKESSA